VAGRYRRRGVARTLIAAAEAVARARGFTRLRVGVGKENESAQALYRTSGFADVGLEARHVVGTIQIRTGPIEVDEVIITLEKPLAAAR